jgi:phosphoribosylanthranilate isomerase
VTVSSTESRPPDAVPTRPNALPVGVREPASGRGRPLVKVCGLTRPEDVRLASELGAWAVGFVFAPSPRRVTLDTAKHLARVAAGDKRGDHHNAEPSSRPLTVGVFGDTSTEAITMAVNEVGLGAVQLHGAEPDAFSLRKALAGDEREVLLIQTVAVSAESSDPAALLEYVVRVQEHVDLILFDTRSGGRSGGTGRTFPWDLVREACKDLPYLVAGGIGPRNARDALSASRACGVDVSSGVESSPGVKDHDLLRALFALLD